MTEHADYLNVAEPKTVKGIEALKFLLEENKLTADNLRLMRWFKEGDGPAGFNLRDGRFQAGLRGSAEQFPGDCS